MPVHTLVSSKTQSGVDEMGGNRRLNRAGCCATGRGQKRKEKKKLQYDATQRPRLGSKQAGVTETPGGVDEEGEGAVEEGIIYLCSDSESLAKSQSRRVEIRKQREEAFSKESKQARSRRVVLFYFWNVDL